MDVIKIIKDFKTEILKIYGNKLVDIILYGSYARNDYNENSDIDLIMILSDEIIVGDEINRIIDIIYNISLEHDVLLSVVPVTENEYKNVNSVFLINVRKEGKVVA